MKGSTVVAGLLALLWSAAASADDRDLRLEIGLDVGWMIWGGANPTGGLVFVPSARVSMPVPGASCLDVQYTQAPMLLAPFARQTGLVDANDLGIEIHTAARAIGVAIAGTVAPLYGTFCNPAWCYSETLLAWGGGARAHVDVSRDDLGRVARVTVAVRVLYAEPTAWHWPGLPAELRRVVPTSTMLTAGGSWGW